MLVIKKRSHTTWGHGVERLIAELTRDEGFRERAYRDHLGFLTIGIGFMIDPDHNGAAVMPKAVADLWLRDIIKKREFALDNEIPWWRELSDARQRALLNLSYQIGVKGLLKFEKMLGLMKAGKFNMAAMEALDSRWSSQTPKRAARIAELIRSG